MKQIKPLSLKTSSDWKILRNRLFDISPQLDDTQTKITNWEYFTEDLVSLEKTLQNKQYVIDAGWYPDTDPNGEFRLVLVCNNWSNQLYDFSSRKCREIQGKINELIAKVDVGFF